MEPIVVVINLIEIFVLLIIGTTCAWKTLRILRDEERAKTISASFFLRAPHISKATTILMLAVFLLAIRQIVDLYWNVFEVEIEMVADGMMLVFVVLLSYSIYKTWKALEIKKPET